VIGTSSLVYGIGFGVNALGMTTAGVVSARLSRAGVHPARVVRIAVPVLVLASAGALLAALGPAPVLLVVPLFCAASSMGLIMGNAAALAMEHSRDAAGAGSAVLGGVMYLVGGIVSPLGALAGDDTAVPMGCVMLGSALLALTFFLVARRYVARHPEAEAAFA
jgi:MFS transporter, DHA1 family, multidrug resistance protein